MASCRQQVDNKTLPEKEKGKIKIPVQFSETKQKIRVGTRTKREKRINGHSMYIIIITNKAKITAQRQGF